jgi:hypothetical protein
VAAPVMEAPVAPMTEVPVEEAPTDRVYITPLTGVDGLGMKTGGYTLVHVADRLSPSEQDSVAGELLRALHRATDDCATMRLPAETAWLVPRQRGVRSIRR